MIGSLTTLVLSVDFMRKEKIAGFEFPILVLLATLGMMMLISASDFIALYLGLELMSLSLYVVAAYNRDNQKATEAGPQIFRARRAVLRHAALRRLADLWLCRDGVFRGRCDGAARPRQSWRRIRPRIPARRPRLQDFRSAVPYVDARRL